MAHFRPAFFAAAFAFAVVMVGTTLPTPLYAPDLGLLIPAAIGIMLMPEPVKRTGQAKLRFQALRVARGRATA